ncbi:hypothetical protein PV326_011549 [Microctonus aethiopoides]|nr:hypothetical protein PV326_011549 [Microctonus aethiopoides]
MERNYRAISRTAIIKRRQKRVRQCRMLYPNDGFLDNLSVNLHVHNQVDNIPLPGHGTLHEPEQMEMQEHSEIGREQDIEKNYQQNLSYHYNFSFTFNTDGCTISNSTNCSAWPVYLQINELPPHLHKKSAVKRRTDDELLEHMKSAPTTRKITYGVKGVLPLAAFPEFSICKGMVIEAMHAVFLGVVKQHLNLLLTSYGYKTS